MTETRPHISHIQVIHPEDVPRFGPLGAVANAQPLWACHETNMDELTIPILGRSGRAGSTRSGPCCVPALASRWDPTGASRPRIRSSRSRWP